VQEGFTVRRNYPKDGFRITIGVGKAFIARNLQEVIYGLEHYFNEAIPEYSIAPFDRQKHMEHAKTCDCCPLCREDKSLAITARLRER
jgi:hypothetical protein